MQLYFIRHAQSANNALYLETGAEIGRHHDPPLSERGVRQLPHVAALLASGDPEAPAPANDPANRQGFGLTHLYCSLMERAILTASAISETTGVPVEGWTDLHEHGGIFAADEETKIRRGLPGLGHRELAERFPHLRLPDDIAEEGWWNRPYEEEAELFVRARRFFDALVERHGGSDDRVAVVSHAGFYHAVLRVMLGFSSAYPGEHDGHVPVYFGLNNTGITRIDFHENRRAIVYLNRLDHLPADLIT
jgi:2,3-bisphosphoglycerate-dependent phosphoglycerate mutase